MIGKLRSQNEKLRNQLKDLSQKLTETLDKFKQKKNPPQQKVPEFRDEVLKKELENSHSQIEQYKKEISALKARLESFHTGDRYE